MEGGSARSDSSVGPESTSLDAMACLIRRSLAAGNMGGFGLATDDCHKTYEELVAKGVEFVQPPADRPYGIEALIRDNSGNWLVMVEPKEFDASFPGHDMS